MCGITGFWDIKNKLSAEKSDFILHDMTDQIIRRGPDGDGYYLNKKDGIAFGHRRLSIVDLSDNGKQPILSHNKRYIMTYNGELYNTDELRADLIKQGKSFNGHSDTEVLIELIDVYGVEETLKKINGMFVFVVFDLQEQTLFAARDHIGIKPLYWSFQNDVFLFGSELKPFHKFPLWNKEMNPNCLSDYFSFNTIPAPQTIFKDCYKLPPASFLVLKEGQAPKIKKYWSLPNTEIDFECDFEELLSDAVKKQMIADVPLGVFLSGGIDSSLITALMQQHTSTPIDTFTIGFNEATHDESIYAKQVAKHLGTNHHCEIMDVSCAKDIISDLPIFYDEPFADSSQLPSLLLSKSAKKNVTVCISGDGGDELFCGYNRYFYGSKTIKNINAAGNIPFLSQGLNVFSKLGLDGLPLTPDNISLKLKKLSLLVNQSSLGDQYKTLIDLWIDNPSINKSQFKYDIKQSNDEMEFMRRGDMSLYLPDDILQKTDKASMAYGLEVRVPFLDYRVVEAAFKLQNSKHINGNKGKIILRDILKKYIPENLFERPKSGFSVPIANWLKNDMQDMMEYYLTTEKLENGGHLNASIIQKRWNEHKKGTHNWQHSLWGVLMLQMWREHYKI